MYSNLIIKHVFCIFLFLIVFAAIPCILHFVFRLPILPTGASDDQDMPRFFLLLGYAFLVLWFVFFVFGPRLIVPASPSLKKAKTKQEIINLLRETFLSAQTQGKSLFEVDETADRVVVKWNQGINYTQLTSIGYKNVNYLVSFEFLEPKKIVLVHTTVIHTQGSMGIGGARFRLGYSGGMVADAGFTAAPFFHRNEDGTIGIDIAKMRYSTSAIINPAIDIFEHSGWESHFLMFKHAITRSVWSIFGYLCFSLGILTILFGLLMGSDLSKG